MIAERLFGGRTFAGEEIQGGTLTDRGWIASLLESSGTKSTTGQVVNPWTAEGLPAVYACQRAISETVGHLPLKLMKLTERGKEADTDSWLYTVLHDLANPEMTAYDFREIVTRHLVQWGNGYAEIVRDASGDITDLWPLLPWRMSVDREPGTSIKRWTYTSPNGRKHTWRFNRNRPPIMHLMINSVDGLSGRSPIRVVMDSIGMSQAVHQFGADWFGNYSMPGALLSHPQKLSPQARQHLREEWDKVHGGWGNANRLAVLQEGMTYQKMTCPPDEAQFIETKQFQIGECCRIYRVPPFMVGHMEKATVWGSGIEQMFLGWLGTGLEPYLTNWRQVIQRDCLTQRTFRTHEVVWVLRALVKSDLLTRMRAYQIQKAIGAASPNEIRAWEDLNLRDDEYGDQYDVVTNNATPASLVDDGDGGAAPTEGAE